MSTKWPFYVYSLVILLILSLMSFTTEAKTRYYKWDVKYEFKSPDCFKKLVITVNGMSPGPTITAEQGDTVVVEVANNLLTENLAIHWHGIRQIGTPWYDGVEGVTQCPIVPGDTFVYKFVVDRPGTYLYHAHYGMQREEGLNGMIQVSLPRGQSEPFAYDFDRSIMLRIGSTRVPMNKPPGWLPFHLFGSENLSPLLINGRGRFNCSSFGTPTSDSGACNATNPECSPFCVDSLNFEIEGHNMTVVEADGHLVEPFEVKNLFIYSGETYSVLVKANQDPSRNYWATTNVVSRRPQTPTGPVWNDTKPRVAQSIAIRAREGFIEPPPATPDRWIMLLNTQNRIDGYIKWAINNVSFTLPTTPYLIALKENKLRNNLHKVFNQRPPPNGYDWQNYDIYTPPPNVNATTSNSIYRLRFGTTIDIVLQNANMINPNNSETHPWHLHGHDFWVLGYGSGKFDPFNDPKKYNLVNPIMKNTVPLHPYGWTAIRFKADNPGVWLFHCHIDSHFFMGMGIVFEEGVERVGKLPASIMGCGLTKGLISP
ncbi:L-ascorbate oxidase [Bienertia sinuspersici]